MIFETGWHFLSCGMELMIYDCVTQIFASWGRKLINGINIIKKEDGNWHAPLACNFNGAVNLLLKRIHAKCTYSVCILLKILSIIYHAKQQVFLQLRTLIPIYLYRIKLLCLSIIFYLLFAHLSSCISLLKSSTYLLFSTIFFFIQHTQPIVTQFFPHVKRKWGVFHRDCAERCWELWPKCWLSFFLCESEA